MAEWNLLTDLTGDRPFVVTAVRLEGPAGAGVTIQGEFELPPLAGLRYEDQVFVSEFVRCHGSIKYMEKVFGIQLSHGQEPPQSHRSATASGRGRGSERPRRGLRPPRAQRDRCPGSVGEVGTMRCPPYAVSLRIRGGRPHQGQAVVAGVHPVASARRSAAGGGSRRVAGRPHHRPLGQEAPLPGCCSDA